MLEFNDAKVIAQRYATLENTISVPSDLEGRRSYLHLGGVLINLALNPVTEINSIWADDADTLVTIVIRLKNVKAK